MGVLPLNVYRPQPDGRAASEGPECVLQESGWDD